jgi:hypothetical protein
MLKEFIEAISEQAVEAAGPCISEADPTKTYAVRNGVDGIDFVGGRVPWRKHKAMDLLTIAEFVQKYDNVAIWYSREAVVLLTDDDERFDRVTVTMLKSPQIRKLIDLEAKQPMLPQRDFLFMLRTVFTPHAFPTAPRLIDILRQVKFEAGAKVEGNVGRGKSSIGKEITAAATFLDTVPEQVTINVPLFDNPFLRKSYDVICALEIQENEQRLQLFPLPGEIEGAFARAESDLAADMRGLLGEASNASIYYGQP